jgi:DNA replication and repair protein RecF
MHVRSLSLTNFRNYRHLELSLPGGALLFVGENAQGKSNLLEALYLLATTRSVRATTDSELIHQGIGEGEQPVARLVASVERRSGPVELEIAIVGQTRGVAAERASGQGAPGRGPAALKRLRVNGVVRRASDMVGQLAAVLFTSQDIDLVGGPPVLRRRFLDITLSQIDREYLRALQRYQKTMTQRNALLRRLQEGAAHPDELAFWDGEQAKEGGHIVAERASAVVELASLAAEAHGALTEGEEELTLTYQPQLGSGWDSARAASAGADELSAGLLEALAANRRRDVAAGVSLLGPHRDDLLFVLDGQPAAAFASRGQQRTAALALRLAEARFLLARSGERPVLLLDDVLSELDEKRRRCVQGAADGFDQVLITSTEADSFDRQPWAQAAVYCVKGGRIEVIDAPPGERQP